MVVAIIIIIIIFIIIISSSSSSSSVVIVSSSSSSSSTTELLSQIKQVRLYNSPTISAANSHKKDIFYHELDPMQGLYENDVGPNARLHKGRYKAFNSLKGHQLIYLNMV